MTTDLDREFQRLAEEERADREEEERNARLAEADGEDPEKRESDLLARRPFNAIKRVNSYTLAGLRAEKAGPIDAIATPWPTVNRMCMMAGGRVGIAHGWHVILAAASNRGKTTFALNMAVNAMRSGENVLYFALESDMEELTTRVASIASGIPLDKLTRGRHYDAEEDLRSHKILLGLPGDLFMNAEPLYQVADMRSVVESFHSTFGIRTFFVDHMQLAQAGEESAVYAKITEVSNELNTLAKRHNLVSVGLSQLTTAAARDHDNCPNIYQLLGGGPLINDANLIFLVDHCNAHYKTDHDARRTDTVLVFGKNRHGPTGELPVRMNWNTSTVRELTVDDDHAFDDFR